MTEQMTETFDCDSTPTPKVSWYFSFKWFVDVFITILTLPVTGLLILFFMLLVKLTSKGPVIYSQIRCCEGGKPFKMYKIRSMVADAEKGVKAQWSTGDDPRVTRVGKLMRKLHIDEMTQIWNVWRGEMNVIGPRPERPEFIEKLEKEVPGYSHRMLVKPGLTGYAQINLPPDSGLETVHEKVILDFEYIEEASPWFDFCILLGTIVKCVRGYDNLPLKLCGVYRNPADSPWAEKIGLLEDHKSVYLTPAPERVES
jgi:lipopolysaccharide/colanic/teichoic acid biosynthesis glycosyltransferase